MLEPGTRYNMPKSFDNNVCGYLKKSCLNGSSWSKSLEAVQGGDGLHVVDHIGLGVVPQAEQELHLNPTLDNG